MGGTLDFNRKVSFAKQDGIFPGQFFASDGFQSYFHEQSCCQESPSSYLAGFVLEHLNVQIVDGAKTSLPIKRTSSNGRIFPYHQE